jgi:hypothetical protein
MGFMTVIYIPDGLDPREEQYWWSITNRMAGAATYTALRSFFTTANVSRAGADDPRPSGTTGAGRGPRAPSGGPVARDALPK